MTDNTPQRTVVAVESPNKPRPEDPLVLDVADALRRIERNYDVEGSGPGSRFEGRLLEDVQAEEAVRIVRESEHAAASGTKHQDAESCGCPKQDGMIRHQKDTCADPIVARLDWYADRAVSGTEGAAE